MNTVPADIETTADMVLEICIHQGYVPSKCYLTGLVVMSEVTAGRDPCSGCRLDRQICGGRKHKEESGNV